jgi:hypothetical protein
VEIDCVAYSNGRYNFNRVLFGAIAHCVSHDPTTAGVFVNAERGPVWASRITGTGTGILGDGSAGILDLYNFINTSTKTNNITVDQQVRGADTRITTGEEGYIDAANDNYGLTNAAAARRRAVEL